MSRLQSLFATRGAAIALAAVVVALLAGAGIFAGPLLLRGPRLISSTPISGAADANPQAELRLEFDQAVQAASLAGAISIDPPAELTISGDGPIVTIRPEGGLQYGADYSLTIDATLRNMLGRPMDGPQTIAFRTLPHLAITAVTPADGAQDLASATPVTVEFNAPVVTAEQVAAAADDPRLGAALPQPLSLDPPAPGAGQWLSPTRYSFAPEAGWSAATTYTLTVQPQLTPDGRARLAQPYSWSFHTAATVLAGTRPFDGQADVPADGEIEVRLARDVDPASASERFTLTTAGGERVEGAVRVEQTSLFFKPAAPLERGASYKASIAPGVRAASGAAINQEALTWSFAVIGDLEVAQVIPPADASEVLTLTNQIAVHFNHPVVAVTAPSDQGSLPQPVTITPPVQGVGRWLDTSTFVISPTVPLNPATDYSVSVAAGLKDQTGGELRQPFSWRFTTIAPQVYGSLPVDGERFFGPGEPLTVVFNQPMDLDSLRGAISLSGPGGSVPGTVAIAPRPAEVQRLNPGENEYPFVSGFSVTFTPAAPLERGGAYTLSVSTAARSERGGANLARAYSAGFTVAPLPRLLDSSPPDGGRDVPNNPLSLTFSAPMDWGSVQQHLTITPKPSQVYTSTDQNILTLYIDLAPEADYTVTLGADARDPYGATLGQETTLRFRTAPLAPSLILPGFGPVMAYSAYSPARVPMQTINLDSVSYTLYGIDRAQLGELLAITQDYERWRAYEPPPGSQIAEGTLEPKGPRNRTTLALADLGSLDAGAYLFEARAAGAVERQLMVVSPTTLTVKRSKGELFVWAVDLDTGEPVANLPLRAAGIDSAGQLGERADLGRTGADGVLQIDYTAPDPYNPIYLWSGDGAPFTLTSTGWGDGIDPWSFSLSAAQERPAVAGNLSTDRPLYRPGEVVHVRGVLRLDDDGRYSLPEPDRQASLAVSDPEGNTIYSTTLALSPFGTFSADLPLEAGAATGWYSMVANLGEATPVSTVYGSFTVAEYRKPVFEITVAPAREDVLQGEQVEATVTARYFAGGALAGAPVRWRLLAAPLYFSAERAPGYQFEDLDDAYASYRWFDQGPYASVEMVAEGEGTTDAQGRLTVSLPGELGKDGHSRALTLDVEVTDVDGQVIAGQGALRLHAGAFYIGLRPDGYVAQAGKPQQVSLLTLDPQGEPVGGRALDVGVYSREWYSVREQGPDGRFYFTSAYTDTLIQSLKATTDAQGRATVSFTPPTGGSYRIGATGKDDGGREVRASAYTWAYGGADVFWGVNDSNRIDLIADKGSYKPGDTAKILVTAPYAGSSALMTIERGVVLEHRLLSLSGTTELLEVPITAAHAPNIYVSLMLITPAGAPGSADAPATPDLRMGLVSLPVSTEQQELNITLTPDKGEVGPRDEVTYSVKTADYTGKGVPAELSLALVDKAVLSLADDPNPSLRQSFYEKRPLGVFTSQSLTALADRVTLTLQPGSKGGGGMAGGDMMAGMIRREFPDTAYWNAAVVTGADGTASVTVRLPDSLTTWRMTARGVTRATEVGQATADVVATRPLLVRPSLPRFLTAGDEPQLGAVVQNSTGEAIEATVTLEVIGPDNQPAPIQLSDAAAQTVSVPANGQAVVRWQAGVTGAGTATVRLRVSGGGLEDAMEQPLPIQRYATPEVAASAGQVLDTTVETLRPPQGGPAEGEVSLELLPSLGAGVRSGLSYLETFPYGCTEQVVSAFLPNAVSYRLSKELGADDAALKASLEQSLASGLQRLSALQNLDGGWGWWEEDDSQPYLSAYVVQGLGEAVKAGYGVDQAMLDRGLAYLKGALEGDADQDQRLPLPTRLNTRAYILFVLGELGQPDRGRAVALFDQRAQLDLYGRAYLLMALDGLGDDERARALAADLTGSAIMRPADAHWEEARADYWTMSSDARTTALALQALVRADPESVLVPNAVRYLVGLRDHGHWRTTQETAVTLMALSEYVAQSGELEGDYSYRVALDDKSLAEGSVGRDNLAQPINLVVSLADLAQGADSRLSIQRQAAAGQSGKGRLYYTLRMRAYQDAASVQPLDQGVGVSREYALVDTATLSPTGELTTRARVGEVVQVRLTLTVPENMPYFMVEDMLPAGLEPLDTSLKTTSAAARDPAIAEAGEQPSWWYFGRTEVRDNRVALFATDLPRGTYVYTYLARAVTPGSFQTLPATAMRTYAPEVFGRSAGALFVVEP